MSFWHEPLFVDRTDAGKKLAARLMHLKPEKPVVAAMLRGGVPVAVEVALALEAPLFPVAVQKIGAPGQPELAMGAVVEAATPEIVWNDDIVNAVCASSACLDEALAKARHDLAARRMEYPESAAPPPIAGRTVIVVDDGIATGASVRAALHALRRGNPKSIVLAVPVILGGGGRSFADLADETVCLAEPPGLSSVGGAYGDFAQVSHDEVHADLTRAARPGVTAPGRM